MTLPWLPDKYYLVALRLLASAPKPFIPPAPGPHPCGISWCTAFADAKSGWPIEGPRLATADDFRGVPAVHKRRCTVHRVQPDFKPRERRRLNLSRVWSAIDRKTARRKKAA